MKGSPVRTSRFLSYVLRHNPYDIGLHLDREGWASINELISCAAKNGRNLTLEEVKEVVAASDKGRFSLSPDGQHIRANYGHSIDVELGLGPVTPPLLLYHGTAEQAVQSILNNGLRPSGRCYVHLSPDFETAINVGKRRGKPVVFQIDSGSMDKDGYRFYCPTNGVWLVEQVPSRYLTRRNRGGIAQEIDSMERLFATVRRLMNSNGFESYYPGFNRDPKVPGNALKWLQYLAQRLYAKDDPKRMLGVNLSMKNEAGKNRIPFLTCGLIQVKNELAGRSSEFCRAGWNDEHGEHLKDPRSPLSLSLYREEQTAIISYFVKYTESMGEGDIRKSIVLPLLKMYEAIPEIIDLASVDNSVREAISAIQDYTLTVEDIESS